jgi:hypothetical protein
MVRGLILGGIAFAAVFFGERQFETVRKDMARYDEMSEMSGQPPLWRKAASMLMGFVSEFGASREGQAMDFLQSIQSDLLRYARIRSM